jgi:hypothetical protein
MPTPNVPFIPACAWPGSVQMKAIAPFFGNVTLSVVLCPFASVFVFLPAILKSCGIFPLLMTVKMTTDLAGTVFFDSTNLNSEAFTVIFFGTTAAVLAPPLDTMTPAASPPTRRPPSINRRSLRPTAFSSFGSDLFVTLPLRVTR